MCPIITVLKKIEENPQMFLGPDINLKYLHFIIEGYIMSEEDSGKLDSLYMFERFKNYFNHIYGVASYYAWYDRLRQKYETEQEAFDKFFELFNDFLEKENITQ